MNTAAPRLSIADFRQCLAEVIAPGDQVVVIHSALWPFAHRFRMPSQILVGTLLDNILEVLGPNRTLVMPTYTLDFPKTGLFDLVHSRPSTGALAEAMLWRPGMLRTPKPMNSYVVWGPHATDIMALPNTTAWGKDSTMGFMERVDARYVMLGVPWYLGCSFYHLGEESMRVPYRYFKRFVGRLARGGMELGLCEETMYSRSLDVVPQFRYEAPGALLRKDGLILECSHPGIPLESARASDILRVLIRLLEEDPYAFIVNRREVERWVHCSKQEEIASLPPEQCPRNAS